MTPMPPRNRPAPGGTSSRIAEEAERRARSDGIVKYTEAQTIAVQRLMPMGPAFGMSDEKYAALLNASLRLMKGLHIR